MDVIASTAFGLDIDSKKDHNNRFVEMARKAFDVNFSNPKVLIACKYIHCIHLQKCPGPLIWARTNMEDGRLCKIPK